MPRLVIHGIAHELVENLITIGREPDNTIVIGDTSVSDHHAELQLIGENYRLKDLGSSNGTRVNEIPMTETALRFGDRIHFGTVEARYEADAPDLQRQPRVQEMAAKPADLSVAPADFANASPFGNQNDQRTTLRTAILLGTVIILLIFAGSMVAVALMHAPGP